MPPYLFSFQFGLNIDARSRLQLLTYGDLLSRSRLTSLGFVSSSATASSACMSLTLAMLPGLPDQKSLCLKNWLRKRPSRRDFVLADDNGDYPV
jgi:hypothetical protein